MLAVYLYSLASVLLVSALSLVGLLSIRASWLSRCLFLLVSLAIGALLGDAFIHLIPEAFDAAENSTLVSLLIIGGVLLFFIIERFLHWHHHQGTEMTEPEVHPVGPILLVSDGVHNFIDGLIIGLSYAVSIEVGIATTIAVILHEIPQEFGDFGVLMHAGYTRSRALFLNFVTGLAAVIGAVIALALGTLVEDTLPYLLPITAGGFIYIALADLIPELHKSPSVRHTLLQLAAILVGVLAMLALLTLE